MIENRTENVGRVDYLRTLSNRFRDQLRTAFDH
jgi:hypothetical protein